MSTITSPRPSLASLTTPSSSRRASLDTTTSIITRSRATSPARGAAQPPQHQRRNRAALRDYYGLKNTAAPANAGVSGGLQLQLHEDGEVIKESELDREGFDAEGYVRGVLEREGLEGVLRVEGGLINEIKGLDGERKALVYDNYSKLITATDTIRKMRMNMDPLTPTTSTLSPTIAHIAETATTLAASLQVRTRVSNAQDNHEPSRSSGEGQRAQRETVKWVLDTPRRLRGILARGERDKAVRDWTIVEDLLKRWTGVEGVDQVRQECLKVLENQTNDPESGKDIRDK